MDAEDELVGLRFNTIGVSDGISMGTPGMSYSLPSREIIADSIESVSDHHMQLFWFIVFRLWRHTVTMRSCAFRAVIRTCLAPSWP